MDIGNVKLVDEFDNQPGWGGAEALYVRRLEIGPGSYLDLNGLNLYYLDGSIGPAALVVLNGGRLVQIPEPAMLGLLGLGGAAGLCRRRRWGDVSWAGNGGIRV